MRYKDQRVRGTSMRLANFFLFFAGLACTVALGFILYHYQWVGDRQFTVSAGKSLYYSVPAVLAIVFFASLRLKPRHKINLTLFSFILAVSLYVDELLLEGWQFISRNWPAEITEDTIPARANIATRLGVAFDRRSRLQVIADLRQKGVVAVPATDPQLFLSEHTDGKLKWNINLNGKQLFPLGGIANKTTVFCNENGAYTLYESDEHGFRNPLRSWSRDHIEIAALGDSFTHGACVPSDKTFVALIQKYYPATLNLGIWGMGPLSELAVLKEYVSPLAPKIVLWFYFEGNDVTDLALEKNNPILMRYFGENFQQNLLSRQDEIDRALTQLVNKAEADATARKELAKQESLLRLADALLEMGKLPALRQKVGLVYGKTAQFGREMPSELDPALLALFDTILLQAETTVSAWHGRLYFVYLPEWARYAHPEHSVKNRERVLQLVRHVGIPLIDVNPTFQAYGDTLSLFPFRGFGHYNEVGSQLVAKTVLRSLSFGDLLPKFDPSAGVNPISAAIFH